MLRWAIALVAFALAVQSASAEPIIGRASVIDGDTIEIHGERIRILDIDALESKQRCVTLDGAEWRCGQQAALALSDWIAQRSVRCEGDKFDKYRRRLARCSVAGQDLGEWMAANGWAVPYKDCKCEVVRNAAGHAQVGKLGAWGGTFVMPWEWRAQKASEQLATQKTTPQQSTTCLIKGNINSKGARIYHIPGGRWYDATKIDQGKGERWFCSEAEATAAGWRPAKQ